MCNRFIYSNRTRGCWVWRLHRIPRRFVYMSEGIKGGLGLMWAIKPDTTNHTLQCVLKLAGILGEKVAVLTKTCRRVGELYWNKQTPLGTSEARGQPSHSLVSTLITWNSLCENAGCSVLSSHLIWWSIHSLSIRWGGGCLWAQPRTRKPREELKLDKEMIYPNSLN